ncbi:hypothetical protein CEUSTIGMA_g1557.t1 [Chlamydomonas eustigma]|uniref:dolichyl-diphosphooligosaccharide--protein glycotransferase n=1 Tax=Chlamydomonas eustigma TaxID=1157962 RepID=A0A250WTF9_9CHLO|nr:hypothetical protein CEUSTIGMA_g1557.t1 [Chlamydomonas eustigma]|eukprot:GAX74108.1 hypothetical protein CEUSTIGMA_g1557.t1 [Chlamydomonas eustigma]
MTLLTNVIGCAIRAAILAAAFYLAYDIRMYAIREYGRLIHEFDPWFNFYATRYLFDNGIARFFKWFDHRSWYPLGRPVGTTIYPGMQLTSVAIYHFLERIGMPMSLNDVCVFVPTWFGGIASVLTGYMAAECSGIPSAAPAAALMMAIIPAHIMRSVGGGYDNESIAVTTMVLTFFTWCRSLRNPSSWPFGILAGLAYVYMVAAWGGYTFVINMVGLHAGVLLMLGRFSPSVYKAYTLFFIVGTAGAIQVPVVSWTPLKSMEQIAPLAVFGAYQILGLAYLIAKQRKIAIGSTEYQKLRNNIVLAAGGVAVVLLGVLVQTGHFGPMSARVRGLFLKHTRTGNPLVDSVAEHQPTTNDAYWRNLHYACLVGPVGFGMSFFKSASTKNAKYFGPENSKIFLILYGVTGYFFATKMARLIILMGPIASALSGVALGALADWCIKQFGLLIWPEPVIEVEEAEEANPADAKQSGKITKSSPARKEKAHKPKPVGLTDNLSAIVDTLNKHYKSNLGQKARIGVALISIMVIPIFAGRFFGYCHMFAKHVSNPSLVFKAQLRSGEVVLVDDYLVAYHWLNANTPEDARVLSWWDYGYQITGIGNRTTLADGNTWNLEHIALIARCLSSKEPRAHELIRHLADYVLVWAGGQGDDLAKSPHIARIGNSVYNDICGTNDPLCYSFGFYDRDYNPTPKMAASLLYKLVMNGKRPGVTVDDTLFREVYQSKYGMVRIYKVLKVSKKSKAWLADPTNRLCDAPGSWYCPGQYPPDLPEKTHKAGEGHATLDYKKHGMN